jgi:hypothetical protein
MNLAKACQALGVSRSGYHAHLRKHERPRRRQDAQLAIDVRAAFTDNPIRRLYHLALSDEAAADSRSEI